MASTTETGHNKNVANFSNAYQIFEEMGSLYNPSNSNLQLANLAPIKVSLAGVITVLNDKKPIYKNVVADREIEIATLGKITTRALNFAKSLNISTTDKDNLASQAKKIRGDQKTKVVNPDTAEGDAISTSQMSYDSRIANLDTYTSQLASHPEYTPNETEIQITSLQTYHQRLVTLSGLVNSAGNALITARKNRNDILYFNDTNIIQLIKEIKAYLKSLGQAGEPYYKALVKLQFKDIKK
ncbi:hypothetical protein [Flavobacterium psychrophilum]|uniref:Uncharacterized protein n=1 Tax=Flavobacterium psychrophilum TaxID=96345 RepID=A0A7U2RAC6_FLAPS|nr:hypothetical protein [Flavobacterium psychrophilum]ELM3645160.1 hypothetical protein [Flavobacterium psychrophilum]MBF2093024.1 hypothetical protein [Flavobacterium psychrophilum]OAE90368.1 hypothetical protein SU65_11540 [Flavobacterium psychrophilum]OAE90451.1 hypothetical protein SU65_11980 [Flavobacterium psychrophilum]OJH11185.1 hypothetical protein FPG87_13090 [Flavobacterium psychrophilum]